MHITKRTLSYILAITTFGLMIVSFDSAAVTIESPVAHQTIQRTKDNSASVPVSGATHALAVKVEARGKVLSGQSGQSTSWELIDNQINSGNFSGDLKLSSGLYEVEIRVTDHAGRVIDTLKIEPVGVGDVFIIAGQSNSANYGYPKQTSNSQLTSARISYQKNSWGKLADPSPLATGNGGSAWPEFADLMSDQNGVPIGIVSVGVGSTMVDQWKPGSKHYRERLNTVITSLMKYGGFRAILWHQGESDSLYKSSESFYQERLSQIIQQSRVDAGWNVPWGIAIASYHPSSNSFYEGRIATAQKKVIDSDSHIFKGAITDGYAEKGFLHDKVHFNQQGLNDHANQWFKVVRALSGYPDPLHENDSENDNNNNENNEDDKSTSEPKSCNQLSNSDFTDGLTNWSNWGGLSHSRGAAKITGSSGGEGMSQDIAGAPGVKYQLSGEYQANHGGHYSGAGLHFLNHSGDVISSVEHVFTKTSIYQSFTVEGTAPAGTVNVQTWVWLGGQETVLIDNLQLKRADCAGDSCINQLTNPGFESGRLFPWYQWNQARVIAGGRSGTQTLELNGAPASAEQKVSGLKPNTTYRLSGYAKNNGTETYIGAKFYGGKDIDTPLGGQDYTGNSITFTTGTNYTSAVVYCYAASGQGRSHCDDMQLVENHCETINGSKTLSQYKAQTPPPTQDFGQRGLSDVLWRNHRTGMNWLYQMSGEKIIRSKMINQVKDLAWNIAGVDDFNGDGKSDLLLRHQGSGKNWMYLMNGTQILSSVLVNRNPDQDWQIAGTGDFNGDKKADILWRHQRTGQNWMHLMDGNKIVSSAGVNKIPVEWKVVGLGDLDGNGKTDIILRHQSNGTNWVYMMDGVKIRQSVLLNKISDLDWEVMGVGDFNADQRDDILWRHQRTGLNWVYLMEGNQIKQSQGINKISDLHWQVVGTGDYNGDNRSDILWRHAISGQNWMHLMDGAKIKYSRGVNKIADQNWQVE